MFEKYGAKERGAYDGDYKRDTRKRAASSEGSASSDQSDSSDEAEADKLHKELENLIAKHKRIDEGLESDSSSSSDSSSPASSSSSNSRVNKHRNESPP